MINSKIYWSTPVKYVCIKNLTTGEVRSKEGGDMRLFVKKTETVGKAGIQLNFWLKFKADEKEEYAKIPEEEIDISIYSDKTTFEEDEKNILDVLPKDVRKNGG